MVFGKSDSQHLAPRAVTSDPRKKTVFESIQEDDDETEPLAASSTRFESRVTEPEKGLAIVRTQRTLASVMCGLDSIFAHTLYEVSMENPYFTTGLFVLWYAGASLGLLALVQVLPMAFIYAGLLMIPLPLLAWMLLCKDLVLEVLRELEFYVVSALHIVVLASAVFLLQGEQRVFWYCFAPTMGLAGMADAYPARARPLFARFYFSGMTAVLVIWNLMLIFGWCEWKPRFYNVGRIRGSLAACSFTTSFTVLLFFVRHVCVAFQHPDRFVIIRSHVKTYHKSDLQAFDAGDGTISIHEEKSAPRLLAYSPSIAFTPRGVGEASPREDEVQASKITKSKSATRNLQRFSTEREIHESA